MMKKIAGLMLALVLSLSLFVSAFANEPATPDKEELYEAYMAVVEERPFLTETLEYIPMTPENFDMMTYEELESFADFADAIIAWQSEIPDEVREKCLAHDTSDFLPVTEGRSGLQRVRRFQTVNSGAKSYTLIIYGYFDTKLDKANDRQVFDPNNCSITIQIEKNLSATYPKWSATGNSSGVSSSDPQIYIAYVYGQIEISANNVIPNVIVNQTFYCSDGGVVS